MEFWFTKGVRLSRSARDKAKTLTCDNVKSIAVIRHAALGDMVLTRAFLIEARKAFSNAKITLSIVSNYTRGTPEDLVDRVHIIHGSDQKDVPIYKRIRKIKELGAQDIIFDLAATNRSVLTTFFNKATLKIGFPYNFMQGKLFYDVVTCRSDLEFEVNNMLGMLHVFGFKTLYPHVYNMPGEPLRRSRPYILYFTGASTPTKCWPAEYFTSLIREMAALYPDIDHLVLEGIQDWEKADRIIGPIADMENISSIEADNIEDTVSLIKGCRLLVSNDTGIRHLAIVSNIPTVGIFFSGPYRYWPRYPIHEAALPKDAPGPPAMETVKTSCIEIMEKTSDRPL